MPRGKPAHLLRGRNPMAASVRCRARDGERGALGMAPRRRQRQRQPQQQPGRESASSRAAHGMSAMTHVERSHNTNSWRWRRALLLAAPMVGAVSSVMTTIAAAVAHQDGVTYCWQVNDSIYENQVDGNTRVTAASGDDCPLKLEMVIDQETFYVDDAIEVTWTATERVNAEGELNPNKLNATELYAGQDRVSQEFFEIVRSRLYSCVKNENCDAVRGDAQLIDSIPNKATNFTNFSASFSTERLSFSESGNVTIMAHIVLPGEDPEQQRFDYAVYQTITIDPRATIAPVRSEPSQSQSQETASIEGSRGLSVEVICIMFVCGIVALALAAIGFTTFKNRGGVPIQRKNPEGETRQHAATSGVDDEFAMLSNEEHLMQSQRPRGNTNTFLSALARRKSSGGDEVRSKPEVPVPFVGPVCNQSYKRQAMDVGSASEAAIQLGSDDHIVDDANPSSMRHKGVYIEMSRAPKPAAKEMLPPFSQNRGPSQIYFNDITEDEIVGNQTGGNSRNNTRKKDPRELPPAVDTVDPYATAQSPSGQILSVVERLKGGLGSLDYDYNFSADNVGIGASWNNASRMTFDDLRESVDLGPALTMDDLESMRLRRKASSNAISEAPSEA